MAEYDLKLLQKEMKEALNEDRFEHTLGVMYTAESLAMRYGVDMTKAAVAGLLHDCAKCMDNAKKIQICEKHNIPVNDVERKNPSLLHAKAGSFIAMDTYGITDTDIINAILNHTTGRPNMSLLEKIIYVADYIEPNRTKAPNLSEIRKLAFSDLNKALLMILSDTLTYLTAGGGDIAPMTRKAYEYYQETLNTPVQN
mgnify:CR=1 FL=1